jgi:uncharacterized protein
MNLAEIIDIERVDPNFAMPFNHRVIGDEIMVANLLGDFTFLTPADFTKFIEGDVEPGEPLYKKLADNNLIRSLIDIPAQAARYARKKGFLAYGPTLHAMVLTERCNHGCQYCHSSVVGMKRVETDMSEEVARQAVDMAFQSTSPWMTIEFQGGEPTANWDVLEFIVKYGQEKNLLAKKDLAFALVTNFSLMTDEKLDFLIENRVQICTSLDGPEDLHNSIRLYKDGNSHKLTTYWIGEVNRRYAEMGLDTNLYRVEALPTITRASLTRWKDIVDEYVRLGCRAVFMRKLDPFGFAARTAAKLGYSMDDFIEFYKNALDYIIELNRQGVQVMERNAAIMLCKMLTDTEPNYLDLRTPGGAVIGQIGYHPDGRIYSSDEGRMVGAMNDDMFNIGHVSTHSYQEIMQSPEVRALVLASSNDAQPDCVSCVYKVYCGLQPEYNYKTQGNIWGRMRDSTWCRKHKNIFDYLAYRLNNADEEEVAILTRWTMNRSQEHFLQDAEDGEEGKEGVQP